MTRVVVLSFIRLDVLSVRGFIDEPGMELAEPGAGGEGHHVVGSDADVGHLALGQVAEGFPVEDLVSLLGLGLGGRTFVTIRIHIVVVLDLVKFAYPDDGKKKCHGVNGTSISVWKASFIEVVLQDSDHGIAVELALVDEKSGGTVRLLTVEG